MSVPEDGKHTGKIVTSLTSVLSSLYENQRVTVAAFFAEVTSFISSFVYFHVCEDRLQSTLQNRGAIMNLLVSADHDHACFS